MKRTSYGLTDVGCVRDENQDSFLIHEAEGLYVVADGMGGHAGGEVASAIAVKTIHDVYLGIDDPEATIADHGGGGDDTIIVERLRFSVNRASQFIQQEAQRRPECRGMGTTVVGMVVDEDTAYVAHAGDSRAYLIRPEGLRRLTRDHTWVEDQIRAGLITETQAANSQFRNLLTRSVGLETHVNVDTSTRRIEVGDRYLLCSDGLHGVISDAEIYRIVLNHSPKAAAQRLVALGRERGAPDNITVVIVVIDEDTLSRHHRSRRMVDIGE